MNQINNVVQLTLPATAEYVSTARLVASSMANRAGFNIDIVEDIKVAVSEICSSFVKKINMPQCSYSINFSIDDSKYRIEFKCPCFTGNLFGGEGEDLGEAIITALMDEVDFNVDSETVISMCKYIEEINVDG